MNLICPHCKSVAPRPADILARETACPTCGRVIQLDEFPTLAAQPAGGTPSSGSLEGNVLGGCRLVRVIGRGGMGEVYEAVQESLNRKVAVKVLPHRLAADEAFVKRFNRESGALAQLSHPNIVVIYDRGHEGQHYYFVLEYVEGADGGPAGTLHRRLRSETPLAITECARLIQQLVEALAYAHGKGVIHRDIKPSNVVLDGRGHARLVDFGLAQMVGVNTAEGTRLTLSGEVLGTAGYVAPEQREGNRQADARVDIYSCGVLLYEMLTGRMPEGAFELPSELVAGLDPAWDAVAEKALQRNPDRRYQTAGEFLDAIRSAAAGQSTVRPVERPPKIPVQPSRRSDTTSTRLTPIVGKCVKCQTVNPGDNRYCTECGANLYEACLACKGENRVGTKYCGKCGMDLAKLKRIAELRREATDLLSQIGNVSREEAKALLQKAKEVLLKLLAESPADDEGKLLKTELDARRHDLALAEAAEQVAQAKQQPGSVSLLTQAYATLTEAQGEFPQDEQIDASLNEVKTELRKAFLNQAASAANGSEAMSLLQQVLELFPDDTEASAQIDRLGTEIVGIRNRVRKLLKDGRLVESIEELRTGCRRFPDNKELAGFCRKPFLDRADAANGSEAISLLSHLLLLQPSDTEAGAKLEGLRTELAHIKNRAQNLLDDGDFIEAVVELAASRKRYPDDKDLEALEIAALEGQRKLAKLAVAEITSLWNQRQLVQLLNKLKEVSRVTFEVPGMEEAKQQATAALLEARQLCEKGEAALAASKSQEALACYEQATTLCTDLGKATSGIEVARQAVEAAARRRRRLRIGGGVLATSVGLFILWIIWIVYRGPLCARFIAEASAAEQRKDWGAAKAAYDKALWVNPYDLKAQEQRDAAIFNGYRNAAEKNDAWAQITLGHCYAVGYGVAEDAVEAVKWWRKAAEQNHAEAQINVGHCYAVGYGVPTNYVEAVKWYRKAAEQNDAGAQAKLGFSYGTGQGVAKDEVEAVKWYRKAAEQNNAWAQANLGLSYGTGQGVAKDEVEAVKWYRKAAEQNNAWAQINLGYCYQYGKGVASDWVEAYKWEFLAAAQGDENAKKSISYLETYMEGERIAEGKRRANDWLAQRRDSK